jgi:hypothetical protein
LLATCGSDCLVPLIWLEGILAATFLIIISWLDIDSFFKQEVTASLIFAQNLVFLVDGFFFVFKTY